MSKEHILIVDNEPDHLNLVGLHLEGAGMKVCLALSGAEAMYMVKVHSFDLIVLDIMMDDLNGFEVLERIRSMKLDTPILLLSAIQEAESKVYGFGIGADDYITKPFSPAELVARVQAHIRRSQKKQPLPKSVIITYFPFKLDADSQLIYKHQTPISLSDKETRLLHALMIRPNQAIAKIELYEQVWGHQKYDDNSLNVYINYLRCKIEDDPRQPKYIQTVWGLGYRFMGEPSR